MEPNNVSDADLLVVKLLDLERTYGEYARAKGLSLMELAVLEVICKTPEGCTQKALAALLNCPKQSVNQVVKALLQRGLVCLREEAADRRTKTLRLSEKGEAFAGAVMGPLWQADEAAMARLGKAQSETLIHLMEQYRLAYRDIMQESIAREKQEEESCSTNR